MCVGTLDFVSEPLRRRELRKRLPRAAIRHAAIVEQDIYPVTYQRVWRPGRVSKLARIVPGLTFQILLPGTASSSTRSANPDNSQSTSRSPVGMLAESDDKRYPEARARTFRELALAGEPKFVGTGILGGPRPVLHVFYPPKSFAAWRYSSSRAGASIRIR